MSMEFSRQEYRRGLPFPSSILQNLGLNRETTRPFRCDLNKILYTVEVTNRFKGLGLVDKVAEELWMEVCITVEEAVTKTIPKNNKCKKAKWLSEEESLQTAEERRQAKSKRERERYTQQNVEFQRIARIDKKVLNEQCKEIEENNRMGKTRDLLKKIRDFKGTFHASMGTIKDRNGKHLTEAE